MMEQADTSESHGDAIFVAGGDDMVVTYASSCLSNISDTALMGTFDVVAKREEGVRTEADARVLCDPRFLLLHRDHLWTFRKELLPYTMANTSSWSSEI